VKLGWSENTIVGAALAAGAAACLIFIGTMFAFCSAMRARANVWMQVGVEIPSRERLGIAVANLWERNWPFLSPILFLAFVGAGLSVALIVISRRRKAGSH